MGPSLSKLIKFFTTEIIYNGHLQSLGSVGIVYFSSAVLHIRISFDFLVLIYLLFQSIYYFDRYRDVNFDKSTNHERVVHINKYLRFVPIIILSFFVFMTLGFLFFSNIQSLMLAWVVLTLGILYPIFFKGLTKKIFLFKNFYVAFVHALLLLFPVIYYDLQLVDWSLLVILFLFVLFEAMIGQFILDTKDIDSDRRRGLKTLPVLIGKSQTLVVVRSLSLFSLIVFISLAAFLGVRLLFIVVAVSFVINYFVFLRLNIQRRLCLTLAAAKFFVWLPFVFLLKQVNII